MAQSKKRSPWVQQHLNDPYVKKAQAEDYRSRAVYKLSEIDEREKLFSSGKSVIDLGAAPGGWTQYAAKKVGAKGQVVAVDILPMEPIPGATIIQGDFTEQETLDNMMLSIPDQKIQLVISDMAPNISGVKSVDQARAMYLAELALDLACNVLESKGAFLVKVFMGEGFEQFLKQVRERFVKVTVRKPKASRAKSRENYILGKGLKQQQPN
jgi:23S rRNA (uridine2552-2'-O)-methyltransferase